MLSTTTSVGGSGSVASMSRSNRIGVLAPTPLMATMLALYNSFGMSSQTSMLVASPDPA